MSTTDTTNETALTYEVFVNDPPPQEGVLPNGEPKRFSPMASTLIYGGKDAVLTDPGMTADQAQLLGDWVAGKGRRLTDIYITHGHGDHWFADDAEELLRTEKTAVDFFNAEIERYPSHLGRYVLWAGVQKLYSARPPRRGRPQDHRQLVAMNVRPRDHSHRQFQKGLHQ